jgi:hypothetical protein
MLLDTILYLVILVTAYPAGLFLAWLSDNEVVKDAKYIIATIHFLVIASIFLVVINFRISNLMGLIYLVLVLAVMVIKGYLSKSKY